MKLLSIGNSFSEDAHGFLYDACKSIGVDIYYANACIGGCSLQMHWDNFCNNEEAYFYQEKCIAIKKVSLKDALTAEKWDIITLQQASHFSGQYETYQPFLCDLYREIKVLCPDAKIYVHKTWAYETDFKNVNFENYNNDQYYMFECLSIAYKNAAESIDAEIIPSGDVIQYLRENTKEFDYKHGGLSLNRDGFHLSYNYGRYAVTLCWCCKLFGVDAFDVKYTPEACDDKNLVNVIKSAVNTVIKGELI